MNQERKRFHVGVKATAAALMEMRMMRPPPVFISTTQSIRLAALQSHAA